MYTRLGDERSMVRGKRRRGEVGKHVSVCMKRDVLFQRGSTAAFTVSCQCFLRRLEHVFSLDGMVIVDHVRVRR